MYVTLYEIFLYFLYLLGYEKKWNLESSLEWNLVPPSSSLYITDDEEEPKCGLLRELTWCFFVWNLWWSQVFVGKFVEFFFQIINSMLTWLKINLRNYFFLKFLLKINDVHQWCSQEKEEGLNGWKIAPPFVKKWSKPKQFLATPLTTIRNDVPKKI